ncbi:MAG TPA: class I SAM-dependent methyltransferase [Stellaceae bacterium]|nr:class I SAM-dependent methyltransferase [Stellaceae bacterium]
MADVPVGSCPLCQARDVRFALAKNGYDIFRCGACNFLFVAPYPRADEVRHYYNANYRAASAAWYPKAGSRARRAFVKSFRFLRHARGRRVLDIGCGGGFMVRALARLGAEASGLDINAGGIAYARAHFPMCNFYCESLAEFGRRGLVFDLVLTTDLLEHLPGVDEFMTALVAITKPGSLVYIATPDSGHPAVPPDLAAWVDVAPPEHLQWFDRRNIELLFQRHGFALARADKKRTPAHSLFFVRRGAVIG